MVSDPVAATDWRQLAAEIEIPDGMFIGGERRAAIDGSTRTVNPARDGSTLVKLAGRSRLTQRPPWRRRGTALIMVNGLDCILELVARSCSASPTWSMSIARRSRC